MLRGALANDAESGQSCSEPAVKLTIARRGAVLREGDVTAGDPIEFTDRLKSAVTIADTVNLGF